MNELQSEILNLDYFDEAYGEIENLRSSNMQVYRVFYDAEVPLEYFNDISKDIKVNCFFKHPADWINSTRENGFFYEFYSNGDNTRVKLMFEEFIKEKNIKADLEISPANAMILPNAPSYLDSCIPEVYYIERGKNSGVPFMLSIDLKDPDAEKFSLEGLNINHHMFGWWNNNLPNPVLELNCDENEKTVNGIKFTSSK